MRLDVDFAILCMQRSGSHMLAYALASHPDVVFHGELLDFIRYSLPFRRVAGKLNCVIVMYNQIDLADKFEIDLSTIPVIHLTRDDRATAISNIRNNLSRAERGASHTAHFTSRDQVPGQYSYVPQEKEIETWLKLIADWRKAALPRIAENRRTIQIDYDEMTGGNDIRELPPESALRLCEFLSLPMRPLTVDIVKSS